MHKKYDSVYDLVCIVLIYLLYIAKDKRHSEKNESDHGGAARRASSGMAFVIETKSSPPHVRDGLIEGPVEGLYISNSLNLLIKNLISTLIYFILSFRLLPTQSPQNRSNHAPPHSRQAAHPHILPRHCAGVFLVDCCVFSVVGRLRRSRHILFLFSFLRPISRRKRWENAPPIRSATVMRPPEYPLRQ